MTEYHSNQDIDIQAYVEKAHRMRADYIRASFADFVQTIKKLALRLGQLFQVPRTEKL